MDGDWSLLGKSAIQQTWKPYPPQSVCHIANPAELYFAYLQTYVCLLDIKN